MNLPSKMRVVEVSKPGGPEALLPAERPLPVPKAHEILIKVAAAGVNRPDVLQRMGYTNVFSLAGGWKAWKESDAPVESE